MRYRAMAKHYLYERARASVYFTTEDGTWLSPKGKEFTPAEFLRFKTAVIAELDRMRDKLLAQKILGE